MERQKHICVADGSAFRNGNIPDRTDLRMPDLYEFARQQRRQIVSADFGKVVVQIAQAAGLKELTYDAKIAIQGGIVCATAGCDTGPINVPIQRPSMNSLDRIAGDTT